MERLFTTLESRGLKIEKRADGSQMLIGYAAVYYREGDAGTEYRLWESCVERIAPGCFDRAISEDDVRALFNHEEDHVLGRTKSKTCRLSADSVGLRYEIDLTDPACPENLPQLIARGDISGSSFSFAPRAVEWLSLADGTEVRMLKDVQLFDVGPVTFPAYEATSCGMRSLSDLTELRAQRNKLRAQRNKLRAQQQEVEIRSRLMQIEDGLLNTFT